MCLRSYSRESRYLHVCMFAWVANNDCRYTMIFICPILFISWKIIYRTPFHKPHEVDLQRDVAAVEDYTNKFIPTPPRYVLLVLLSEMAVLTVVEIMFLSGSTGYSAERLNSCGEKSFSECEDLYDLLVAHSTSTLCEMPQLHRGYIAPFWMNTYVHLRFISPFISTALL